MAIEFSAHDFTPLEPMAMVPKPPCAFAVSPIATLEVPVTIVFAPNATALPKPETSAP